MLHCDNPRFKFLTVVFMKLSWLSQILSRQLLSNHKIFFPACSCADIVLLLLPISFYIMDSRRSFLKKAALLSGAAGIAQFLPGSVQRAFAIEPDKGTTYLDAEHIVFLMQENRSFDHMFGTLRGVRGFNDPRAISLPDMNKVFLQTNGAGETYAPFHLDIHNTKATWMNSLPHSRESQIDAHNAGKHDNWLDAKRSGNKEYANMPLTMGYYTREDIPFYYALADAFTVCDQHFCSSLTGTNPNRLFFWTGTIRAEQNGESKANVRNQDVDYDYGTIGWDTFPQRLEDAGISWKVYQNEISIDGGFTDEEDSWLSNFGDNPLEYFSQYHTKLSERYTAYLPEKIILLGNEINALGTKAQSLQAGDKDYENIQHEIKNKKTELDKANEDLKFATKEIYEALSEKEKALHQKAFTRNVHDADAHELTDLKYNDSETMRDMHVPKGDLFHQFREDVNSGNLPIVSWLVAPENFSDHPASAWYGAWYVSEAMDILTKNPEVWKKTIFVLTYDENDGYFDHVPPFVAHHPERDDTGKSSASIDVSTEYVKLEQELEQKGLPKEDARGGPVGLGYRVPLVIASPWSRGGYVCSEVFEHTSSLQFLEHFINKKFGKDVKETNISSWRRAISGNLVSAFRLYTGTEIEQPEFLKKDVFLESIHKAQFKNVPNDFIKLSPEEIAKINSGSFVSSAMPQQEKGVRQSCSLPYEIYAEGNISDDRKTFNIKLSSAKNVFGERAAGIPFNVYTPGKYKDENVKFWSYAVAAGDSIDGSWKIDDFENGMYHLRVYGPNGFYREFKGNADDPMIDIICVYERNRINSKLLTGNILLEINSANDYALVIKDNAYKNADRFLSVSKKDATASLSIDLAETHGWYDFTVRIKGNDTFEKRYAGHVETGRQSYTDPAMGGMFS
jgi:phospholipase C